MWNHYYCFQCTKLLITTQQQNSLPGTQKSTSCKHGCLAPTSPLLSSSVRRNAREKRKRKPRRRLTTTPRRRKCCLAWERTLEASWPRSRSSRDDGSDDDDDEMMIERMTVCVCVCCVAGGDEEGQASYRQRDQEEDSGRETAAIRHRQFKGGRAQVSLLQLCFRPSGYHCKPLPWTVIVQSLLSNCNTHNAINLCHFTSSRWFSLFTKVHLMHGRLWMLLHISDMSRSVMLFIGFRELLITVFSLYTFCFWYSASAWVARRNDLPPTREANVRSISFRWQCTLTKSDISANKNQRS